MRTLGRGARLALVCGIWMLTSGCFLNALFSSVVVSTIGEGSHTAVSLQASATVRACSVLTATETFQCTVAYVIDGEDIGSDALLASPFAFLAFLIDPLILQVPAAASNFSGTFGGSSITGSLSITEVPGALPADISTAITPEPGTKLVIVDFPNPPPPLDNQSFGFTLQLRAARRCHPGAPEGAVRRGASRAMAKRSSCPCSPAKRTSPIFPPSPCPRAAPSRT